MKPEVKMSNKDILLEIIGQIFLFCMLVPFAVLIGIQGFALWNFLIVSLVIRFNLIHILMCILALIILFSLCSLGAYCMTHSIDNCVSQWGVLQHE